MENILLKFCPKKFVKISLFHLKIIDNVLLRTIFSGIGASSPDFLPIVQYSVFWRTFSVNFLLRKYNTHLNSYTATCGMSKPRHNSNTVTCGMSKPRHNSYTSTPPPPPENFSNPHENFSAPPKNFSNPENFSTPPENISTPLEKISTPKIC